MLAPVAQFLSAILNTTFMLLVRPRIIGILKSQRMKTGQFVITNNEKSPNKILIYCESIQHGENIISKMINASPGELISI